LPSESTDPDAETAPSLFLSHAGVDTEAARNLKHRLEESGIRVWFDKDDLLPGADGWQKQIEATIENHATAFAVYIGSGGVVNWVESEVRLALSRVVSATHRPFPFIPILSAQAEGSPALPGFARQFQAVHDVENQPAEFRKLVNAIKGNSETRRLEDTGFFGLEAIDELHSHLFFGRERETDDLIRLLRDLRLLMVTGDSGSGKSSLVHAGLLPRWRGGALSRAGGKWPRDEIWHVIKVRSKADPRRALGEAVIRASQLLGRSAVDQSTYLNCALSADPYQRRFGLQCGLDPEPTRTLVVVDQFEEVMTMTPPEQRQPFVDLLLDLANPNDDSFAVVLTMRHDYYNLCSEFPRLSERLESQERRARYLLKRMRDEDLHDVVTKPLELAGVPRENREALAHAVLQDVGERAGDLALVQFALSEMWRQRAQYGNDLLRSYIEVGRVEGALARAAERVYHELGGERNESEFEAILIRLVQLGDTGGAIRRVARRREFSAQRWGIVQKLASRECNRLVLISGSDEEPTAEVAHEALLTQWPRCQGWLHRSAGDKRIIDALIERAARWYAAGQHQELLPLGSDREVLDQLASRRPEWLSGEERAFILAGNAAHQARIKREHEARTNLERLTRSAQTAQSRFLASLAKHETAASNAANGLLLALAALPQNLHDPERPVVSDAEEALWNAISELRELKVLRGHQGPVVSATFSRDGKHILTASHDGTARLWDARSGENLALLKSDGTPLRFALFSADGKVIVTGSQSNAAQLWDARSGQALLTLSGCEGTLLLAVIAFDRQLIITASENGSVQIWDGQSGQRLAVLDGHEGKVLSAAFSSDGRLIVTASDDGTARVWDATSGQSLGLFDGHGRDVTFAIFSPDGQRIVTASHDGTARVWDVASSKIIMVLKGHERELVCASFGPDSQQVATAGRDQTARVWDAESGLSRAILRGHDEPLRFVAISPDGRHIVTASDDGTARMWKTHLDNSLVLDGHKRALFGAMFSPDSRQIVTCSADYTARLWDADSGKCMLVLREHNNDVGLAIFSPDGCRIITASADGTAKVWEPKSGKCLMLLKGHKREVVSAAFSPNGQRIVTASLDETARLWNAVSGYCLLTLTGAEGEVLSATFSPDGHRIVTISSKAAQVWDAESGEVVLILRGHAGLVTSAALSPDGRLLVTGSWDHTARVWDAISGEMVAVLERHQGAVVLVTWSPDGQRIVTASQDGTARLWSAESGHLLRVLKGHEGDVVSATFSFNGRLIATASYDRTARVWDADSGHCLAVLRGHRGLVVSAMFSPDGEHIVTASRDGTGRVWRSFSTIESLVMYAQSIAPRQLTNEQRVRFFLDND
jgi:WD40 repeat protein